MAEANLVETFDEEGNKVTFELVDILTVDNVEYALLLPEKSTEDDDMIVMRLKKEGDEYSFETIDDEDEFNRVADYIEEIEDETDD